MFEGTTRCQWWWLAVDPWWAVSWSTPRSRRCGTDFLQQRS